MRVLAIDPGPTQSAWVIWDGKKILDKGIHDNHKLCAASGLSTYWEYAAIEMIASYGMPVGKSVFDTCVWIGRLMEQLYFKRFYQNIATLIYRKEIKLHLCGSVKAKDANVRQALIDRFGAPGTKKKPGLTYGLRKDIWSAFAVAVTWHDLFSAHSTE